MFQNAYNGKFQFLFNFSQLKSWLFASGHQITLVLEIHPFPSIIAQIFTKLRHKSQLENLYTKWKVLEGSSVQSKPILKTFHIFEYVHKKLDKTTSYDGCY